MDEDEDIHISFNSPKGKLIKLLESKCKKPEVDNSLSEVIGKYGAITEKQKSYLQNGIFNINFAEEALFVQGCALYYCKRIDKLYDELLASHLRLLQYDEKHAKETRNSNKRKKEERVIELKKLESRMNKSKRKKITLVEASEVDEEQTCGSSTLTSLSVNDLEEVELQRELPFEVDKTIVCQWDILEQQQNIPDKVSNVMWEYSCQGYQLENEVIAGEDHPIYDANDLEEYNSRYSKAPSFHHIKQLFQYNDNCLLPDFEEAIAKLRLAFYGTKQFFLANKISRDTSFEKYNEEFNIFARDFYAEERKRIQNMPQGTLNDLRNFYNIIVKREMEARVSMVKQVSKLSLKEVPSVTFQSVIRAPLSEIFNMHLSQLEGKLSILTGVYHKGMVKDVSGNVLNCCSDKASEEIHRSKDFEDSGMLSTQSTDRSMDDTDRDPEMEEVDKNKDNSQLETDPKFRSDSGYFESGFETDTEDNEEHDPNTSGISEDSSLNANQLGENVTPNINQVREENTTPKTNEIGKESTTPNSEESTTSKTNQIGEDTIQIGEESTSPDIIQIGDSATPIDAPSEGEKSVIEGVVSENGLDKEKSLEGSQVVGQTMVVTEGMSNLRPVRNRLIIKPTEFKIPRAPVKRRFVDPDDEPLSKLRKLSLRQMEKLKEGVIKPVHQMKWESFFSMNYQAQTGEGIINPISYDSDSDTEESDPLPAPEEYHSDHEGSHVSDHSYCRPDSAVEFTNDISGEVPNSANLMGNHLDTVIAQFEAGWDAIIRDHMYTPLIPRSTTNSPVPRTLPLSETENSVQEKERKEARKRVDDWKTHIQQKLKKLDEHCFDIHEYGSNIINSMEVNQSRGFKDFVKGRTQTEAIRYFITSLHLANTNNIELCGIQPGQLSNDSLELKLLDKERYHEKLDEYQAPSEEMLREKLSRMRLTKRQNQALPSSVTPSHPDSIDSGLSETPNIKKAPWKGKSTPNLYMKSYPNKKSRTQSPRRVEATNVPFFDPVDRQPSTSRQADVEESLSCSTRSTLSKRLFLQRASSSSHDSGNDMGTGSFSSSEIDELSFLRDLEDLQENSELPIQSTPRSLKVLLDNIVLA